MLGNAIEGVAALAVASSVAFCFACCDFGIQRACFLFHLFYCIITSSRRERPGRRARRRRIFGGGGEGGYRGLVKQNEPPAGRFFGGTWGLGADFNDFEMRWATNDSELLWLGCQTC